MVVLLLCVAIMSVKGLYETSSSGDSGVGVQLSYSSTGDVGLHRADSTIVEVNRIGRVRNECCVGVYHICGKAVVMKSATLCLRYQHNASVTGDKSVRFGVLCLQAPTAKPTN